MWRNQSSNEFMYATDMHTYSFPLSHNVWTIAPGRENGSTFSHHAMYVRRFFFDVRGVLPLKLYIAVLMCYHPSSRASARPCCGYYARRHRDYCRPNYACMTTLSLYARTQKCFHFSEEGENEVSFCANF